MDSIYANMHIADYEWFLPKVSYVFQKVRPNVLCVYPSVLLESLSYIVLIDRVHDYANTPPNRNNKAFGYANPFASNYNYILFIIKLFNAIIHT